MAIGPNTASASRQQILHSAIDLSKPANRTYEVDYSAFKLQHKMARATSSPGSIQVYRCLASYPRLQQLLGMTFWDGQSALNIHPPASDSPRSTFSQTIRETRGAFVLYFPSSITGQTARLILLAYDHARYTGSPMGAPAVEMPGEFASHWLVMARAHLLIEGPTFSLTKQDPEYRTLIGS